MLFVCSFASLILLKLSDKLTADNVIIKLHSGIKVLAGIDL